MTERWVAMVKQSKIDQEPSVEKVNAMVAKLLARQHAAVVRMVKREATESVLRIHDAERRRDDRNALIAEGHRQMCAGMLAALAKQGGGKK